MLKKFIDWITGGKVEPIPVEVVTPEVKDANAIDWTEESNWI